MIKNYSRSIAVFVPLTGAKPARRLIVANSQQNDSKNIMDRGDQMIQSVLSAVEEEPELTQNDSASKWGIAAGMVNS